MFLDFVFIRFRGEPELLNESDICIEAVQIGQQKKQMKSFQTHIYHHSTAQQHIVKADYGMHDSPLTISCRRALIKYLLKRLDVCVDNKQLSSTSKKYQLALVNSASIKRCLL